MIELDERRKEFYRIALNRSSTPYVSGSLLPIPQHKLKIDMYKPQLETDENGRVGHEFVGSIYMIEDATGMRAAINSFALNHLFYAAYARNLIAYREKYGNDQSIDSMVIWMTDSVIRFNEIYKKISEQVGVKFKPLTFNIELLKYGIKGSSTFIPIPHFDSIDESLRVRYLPYDYLTFNETTRLPGRIPLFSYTLSFTRWLDFSVVPVVLNDVLAERNESYTNLLHIHFDNVSGKPPMSDLVEEFLDMVVKSDEG